MKAKTKKILSAVMVILGIALIASSYTIAKLDIITSIYVNGYEDGFASWTTTFGSPTLTATNPHTGTTSMLVTANGGSVVSKQTVTATSIGQLEYWYAPTTTLNDGETILIGALREYANTAFSVITELKGEGGNNYFGLKILENGTATDVWEATPSNPQLNIYIDLVLVRDVTNAREELHVNGILKASASITITRDSTEIVMGYWGAGYSGAKTCQIDDVALSGVSNSVPPPPPPPPEPTKYNMTVGISPNGTTTPAAGTYLYDSGTSVTLTATPLSGYRFDHWLVNGQQNVDNPLNVTVLSETTIVPVFTLISEPPPPPEPTPTGAFPAQAAMRISGLGFISAGALSGYWWFAKRKK